MIQTGWKISNENSVMIEIRILFIYFKIQVTSKETVNEELKVTLNVLLQYFEINFVDFLTQLTLG